MGLRRGKAAGSEAEPAPEPGDAVSRATGTTLAALAAVTTDKPTRKANRKARKAATKAEKEFAKEAGVPAPKDLTPATTARLITVGKALAPLLAPYVIAGAGLARARWDDHRARRLGVPADQLGRYTGPGGALHARISRIGEALGELDSGDAAAREFATATRPRLADLAVAVHAAEQMPTTRRRTAFKAVGGELDRTEDALLALLGVTP